MQMQSRRCDTTWEQRRPNAILRVTVPDLILPTSILDELVELARAATPRECCGLISTHNGIAAKVYPATNIAQRDDRYEIAGGELYDLETRIAYDWPDRLRVFYHSHLQTRANPSPWDIALACSHPDDLHLIVSLVGLDPEFRAYTAKRGARMLLRGSGDWTVGAQEATIEIAPFSNLDYAASNILSDLRADRF